MSRLARGSFLARLSLPWVRREPDQRRRRPRALYIQYAHAPLYPPLEHGSRILANAGWDIIMLGIGALGDADRLAFPPHPAIRVKRLSYASPGWRQKLHYVAFVAWVVAWVAWWRPNWIYVSDALASIAGLIASYMPGVHAVYHEHDAPAGLSDSTFGRACLRARRALGRRAQRCVVPNPERGRALAAELGLAETPLCVANFPRLEEVQPRRTDPPRADLCVYYHGTLVRERVPRSVIQALACLGPHVRLRLAGYEPIGALGYSQQLLDEARRLGVADRVDIHPAVSRHELWALCSDQDVGLSLMPMTSQDLNMRHMVGASNKLTDYLAAGLAVLVSDLPTWTAGYVDPGYGLACNPDDPTSIADALRWFEEHRAETRAMGERGRQRVVREWHYERGFAPLVTMMTDALTAEAAART